MRRILLTWFARALCLTSIAYSAPLFAAEEEAAESAESEGAEKEEASEGEGEAAEKETPPAPEAASADPRGIIEAKDKTYYFVGARYRMVFIPQFILNIFAEGGGTVVVQQPGIEFGIRENGFEYNIFAMLGFYGLENKPFKGKTDPTLAWEMVNANFKIAYLGADFMWSKEMAEGLSLHYGAGIGIGVVWGQLDRRQAYPATNKTNDPSDYRACVSPGNPRADFCGTDTNHYPAYTDLTGGKHKAYSEGSPTPLFPWIAGQIGLRYKIHKHFVMRLDAGIMVPGAFLGLGADYGL